MKSSYPKLLVVEGKYCSGYYLITSDESFLTAMKHVINMRNEMGYYPQEVVNEMLTAIESKNIRLAWRALQSRDRYEYEGVELVSFIKYETGGA